MLKRLSENWPEYMMEAGELAGFLIAACAIVVSIQHTDSPLSGLLADPFLRRTATGLAMGLTAIAIVYSPWGRRSGAHFNPAVTLTFAALGKVRPADALFYVTAHFIGATFGMSAAALIFGSRLAHPAVAYIATQPGPAGTGPAFVAEATISFLLMSIVLAANRSPALAPYTGVFSGLAVATFITFEAPLSGMSMNPARSFGPAAIAGLWQHYWLYLIAPPLGMLLAAISSRRFGSGHCAKLVHPPGPRCIFCGWPGTLRDRRSNRRARWRRITALSLAALVLTNTPAVGQSASVLAVGPINLTVTNLDRSKAFFRDVLEFEPLSEREVRGGPWERFFGVFGLRARILRMRLGEQLIELTEFLTPVGRTIRSDARSNDHSFQHIAIVVSDMDRAFARLRRHRVRFGSPAPQTLPEWNPAAAGIRAFYFKDPDGHDLELLQFPPDKARDRWRRQSGTLFLGIDYTAIVVADTDRSVRFYRDQLGLRVVGESDNHGPEQERLNNVFGARLRITSLRAPAGPGIELLEYLTPGDGRPIPADRAANDIAHWDVALNVASAAQTAIQLRAAHASLISLDPVELTHGGDRFGFALLARDPDGHVVRITEAPR